MLRWTFASLFALTLAAGCRSGMPPTTVYLVRHAEKDLTNPSARNPELTPAGVTRAQHLADRLRSEPITAIYSTPFVRTMNTVKPLADAKKLPVQVYEGNDYKGIQQRIDQQRGKTILICGHSNTLLPIIRQTGAKPPLDTISDSAYDNLFRLVIRSGGRADVTVEKFN